MNIYNLVADYKKVKKLYKDSAYKFGASIEENNKRREAKLKLYEGIQNGTVPSQEFLDNEVMFNLWRNRNTDEPITSRELFIIVNSLLRGIDSARSSAIYSGEVASTIM